MLEDLYTTKMSANKKRLQIRFDQICSRGSRFSRTASVAVTIFVAAAMLCAMAVMAAVENKNEKSMPVDSLSHFEQDFGKGKVRGNVHSASGQPQVSYDERIKRSSISGKSEEEDINLGKNNLDKENAQYASEHTSAENNSDKAGIKACAASDELYAGFEQIILPGISSEEIQKELQDNGIAHAKDETVDLKENYIVKNFTEGTTRVTADENGSISIYLSVENDNLFDIYITDSETHERAESATVLANNDNVYSFIGFEPDQSYDVEVRSKTQDDWKVDGNYILY